MEETISAFIDELMKTKTGQEKMDGFKIFVEVWQQFPEQKSAFLGNIVEKHVSKYKNEFKKLIISYTSLFEKDKLHTFPQTIEFCKKEKADADLAQVFLCMLELSTEKKMKLIFKFKEDNGKEMELDEKLVFEALHTGEFRHPETNELVDNFKENILLFYKQLI
jgi:hypothetical protein